MKTLTDTVNFRKFDETPLFDFRRLATKAAKDAASGNIQRYVCAVCKSPNAKSDKVFLSLTIVDARGVLYVYYSNEILQKTAAANVAMMRGKNVYVTD